MITITLPLWTLLISPIVLAIIVTGFFVIPKIQERRVARRGRRYKERMGWDR